MSIRHLESLVERDVAENVAASTDRSSAFRAKHILAADLTIEAVVNNEDEVTAIEGEA